MLTIKLYDAFARRGNFDRGCICNFVSAAQKTAGLANIWWIFVIVAVILAIVIFLLMCCIYCIRYAGETYQGLYGTLDMFPLEFRDEGWAPKRLLASNSCSRSFILQSVIGRQGVACRHIILLALSLKIPKK